MWSLIAWDQLKNLFQAHMQPDLSRISLQRKEDGTRKAGDKERGKVGIII